MAKWHTFEVSLSDEGREWLREPKRDRVKVVGRHTYNVVRFKSSADAVEFQLKFAEEIKQGELFAVDAFFFFSIMRNTKNVRQNTYSGVI